MRNCLVFCGIYVLDALKYGTRHDLVIATLKIDRIYYNMPMIDFGSNINWRDQMLMKSEHEKQIPINQSQEHDHIVDKCCISIKSELESHGQKLYQNFFRSCGSDSKISISSPNMI